MSLFGMFKGDKVITPEERRKKTIELLQKQGIDYNPNLPLISSSDIVKLKNAEEVRKRTIGSMLCIQLACSIRNGEKYDQSLLFVIQHLKQWNVAIDNLLPKERILINNKLTKKDCTDEFTMQDVIDVAWEYETSWSIIWALDLITDKELKDATKICNTERAMAITSLIPQMMPDLRKTDKILDMLDLFYCYHWACVQKQIHPETKIGKLNPEIVMERRKGLEWLISDEKDWNSISLDT